MKARLNCARSARSARNFAPSSENSTAGCGIRDGDTSGLQTRAENVTKGLARLDAELRDADREYIGRLAESPRHRRAPRRGSDHPKEHQHEHHHQKLTRAPSSAKPLTARSTKATKSDTLQRRPDSRLERPRGGGSEFGIGRAYIAADRIACLPEQRSGKKLTGIAGAGGAPRRPTRPRRCSRSAGRCRCARWPRAKVPTGGSESR